LQSPDAEDEEEEILKDREDDKSAEEGEEDESEEVEDDEEVEEVELPSEFQTPAQKSTWQAGVDIVETPSSTQPAAWDRGCQDCEPKRLVQRSQSVRSSTKKKTPPAKGSQSAERQYPKSKYHQTASGTFVITSTGEKDSPSMVRSVLKRDKKKYEIISSPLVMCVEPCEEEYKSAKSSKSGKVKSEASAKKGKKQRKRPSEAEMDEETPSKMSSKEVRGFIKSLCFDFEMPSLVETATV
jgi:hypothetical protein